MAKKFNVTGNCNPEKHYMVDISNKFRQVMELISEGEYFIINRPRQYGKTTMLNMLAQAMCKQPDKYILARLSFEGLDDRNFEASEFFCPEFARRFIKSLKVFYPEIINEAEVLSEKVRNMDSLSEFITQFVTQSKREVVVLIDEIDKASDNQLFLSFLGMLRNKYLDREAGIDKTFSSVVLAGVHIDEEAAGQNPEYNSKHWTLDDIDWSFRWLTRPTYTTTNFDDMIKNLENNRELYNIAFNIVIAGADFSASCDNPAVNLGYVYGIFSSTAGKLRISNRVYEQRLNNYMVSKQETAQWDGSRFSKPAFLTV